MEKIQDKKEWNAIWRMFLCLLTVGAFMGAAGFLETDYTMPGILAIVAIYLFRSMKTLSVGAGCILLTSIPAFMSLIPIYLYNGKRGRNLKWVFYFFYPGHILLLYLISCALGLGHIVLIG